MKLKQKIESGFEAWAKIATFNPWKTILITLALSALLFYQLQTMRMDLSNESFLPKGDQTVSTLEEFRKNFSASRSVLIALEAEDTFFTLENLQTLKSLHELVESSTPHLDDIDSLVTVSHIKGTEEGLEVKDLVELWPETADQIPAFREMVLANKNYVGNIVSADGKMAVLVVNPNNYSAGNQDQSSVDDLLSGFDDSDSGFSAEFLTSEEEEAFGRKLISLSEDFDAGNLNLYIAGISVISYKIADDIKDMTIKNMSIGFLVLFALLWILFHRPSGMLMPALVVFMTIPATLGLMAVLGVPFTGTTQILPTFLLAIGVADTVHILSIFYGQYDRGVAKQEAVRYAIKKTAIAVLMTTLTTAAGLLSFYYAKIEPTRSLGMFGAAGAIFALIYTLVLVPALLSVLPIKPVNQDNKNAFSEWLMKGIESFVMGMGSVGVNRPNLVISSYGLVLLVSVVGLMQLQMSHDQLRWWPEGNPVRVASETLDKKMSGSMSLDIMVDAHTENALYDPALLNFIDRIESDFYELEVNSFKSRKVNSILNVVKQNHQALNENDPAFYAVPDSRQLIAQELLLFENSGADDLEKFATSDLSKTKMTVVLANGDMLYLKDYLKLARQLVDRNYKDSGLEDVEVTLSGYITIGVQILYNMIYSCIESYFIAFVLVGGLMFLLMGGVRKGLLAFVPNIIPIVLTLGMMGWAGIPLNILTSLLGCVVIGISVDDTIHFMHHYQDRVSQGSSSREAIIHSLKMSGRAIAFTSFVLIGCFLVYAFDVFTTSMQFGVLLSFSIAVALFANLMLAPALLQKFWKFDS